MTSNLCTKEEEEDDDDSSSTPFPHASGL